MTPVYDPFIIRHASVVVALVFAAALLLSLGLTGLVKRLALRFGIVREPSSARHVHTRAIPRVGGVAVFFTVAVLLLLGRCFASAGSVAAAAVAGLLPVMLPATLLFLVGLIDDIIELPAKLKLAAQIGAAVWLYCLGYSVVGGGALSTHAGVAQVVGVAGTVVWVVWITNAVNLIDGLDGLAAGTSLLSLGTLLACACVRGHQPAVLGTALLGGAVVGFLRFNFNPASIFLGDGGSLFIGFMMSALGLMGSVHGHSPMVMGIALPALAFGLPLTEVMLSVSRRFLSGKRLFEPDRMHIHHRLLDGGLNHRQTVLVLYAVSTVFGVAAMLLIHPTPYSFAVAGGILAVLAVAGLVKLRYPEFAELANLPRRSMQQRKVIANTVVVRNAVTLLHKADTLEQVRHALEAGFPSECFTEMRFHLWPHMHPAGAGREAAGLTFTKQSPKLRNCKQSQPARLVMDLAASNLRGTLEFVVSDASSGLLLNLNQVFRELHPALNAAVGRISGDALPASRTPVRTPQPLLFPAPRAERTPTFRPALWNIG